MKQLLSLAVALVLAQAVAFGQAASPIQQLFESGKYKEVVSTAPADAPPATLYLVGLSHQNMRNKDAAREVYGKLSVLPESDPWHFVGMSAAQFLDSDIGNERDWVAAHNRAIDWAEQATKLKPEVMEAHYALGLVLVDMEGWAEAGKAFDRAIQLNPNFAYAHYYAGRANNRTQRPQEAVAHFETFLKLAPNAPERAEVQQMIKTASGK